MSPPQLVGCFKSDLISQAVLKESSRFLFYFVLTCAVIRRAVAFSRGERRYVGVFELDVR